MPTHSSLSSQYKAVLFRKFTPTYACILVPSLSPLTSYFRLHKKYNKFNVQLNQTGAGLFLEELKTSDDKVKQLLG